MPKREAGIPEMPWSIAGSGEEFIPYLVAVNLTRRCNLACAHCYLDAGRRATPGEGELTRDELAGLFGEIGERAPGTILVLTGGEPLMHPDLESLVAAGVAARLRVVLGTNGVLLREPVARRLKDAGLEGMGISLDSAGPTHHDAFRGVPGAFAKTCAAIRICREAGIHVQVHFTVTRRNRGELAAVVELARELGAGIINFFFLICVGRGDGRMDLSAAEYEAALREIAALQKTSKGILVQTRCTPHFKRVLYQMDPESPYTRAVGYDGGGCPAATHYCRVTPEGDVTPCPYMEIKAGNIRDGGFWKIWDEARLLKSMRNPSLLKGRCGSCEFKALCGGCRAKALAAGDLMGEDPSCEWQPQGGPEIRVARPLPEPALSAACEPGDTAPRSAEPLPDAQAAVGPEARVSWTPEALERLSKVPLFLRHVIRGKLEARARAEGGAVTAELMARHRREREQELGLKFK